MIWNPFMIVEIGDWFYGGFRDIDQNIYGNHVSGVSDFIQQKPMRLHTGLYNQSMGFIDGYTMEMDLDSSETSQTLTLKLYNVDYPTFTIFRYDPLVTLGGFEISSGTLGSNTPIKIYGGWQFHDLQRQKYGIKSLLYSGYVKSITTVRDSGSYCTTIEIIPALHDEKITNAIVRTVTELSWFNVENKEYTDVKFHFEQLSESVYDFIFMFKTMLDDKFKAYGNGSIYISTDVKVGLRLEHLFSSLPEDFTIDIKDKTPSEVLTEFCDKMHLKWILRTKSIGGGYLVYWKTAGNSFGRVILNDSCIMSVSNKSPELDISMIYLPIVGVGDLLDVRNFGAFNVVSVKHSVKRNEFKTDIVGNNLRKNLDPMPSDLEQEQWWRSFTNDDILVVI